MEETQLPVKLKVSLTHIFPLKTQNGMRKPTSTKLGATVGITILITPTGTGL